MDRFRFFGLSGNSHHILSFDEDSMLTTIGLDFAHNLDASRSKGNTIVSLYFGRGIDDLHGDDILDLSDKDFIVVCHLTRNKVRVHKLIDGDQRIKTESVGRLRFTTVLFP